MKIFKNSIFTFILGAIIFGSIGVVASQLFAHNIGYTPFDSSFKKINGENITNVGDAIDKIYDLTKNYECVRGSHVWTQNDTDNGFVISNFVPTQFSIEAKIDQREFIIYYNKNINQKIYQYELSTNTLLMLQLGSNFIIDDSFKLKWSNNWVGKTIYYMACK